jgi:hypothetical protein
MGIRFGVRWLNQNVKGYQISGIAGLDTDQIVF